MRSTVAAFRVTIPKLARPRGTMTDECSEPWAGDLSEHTAWVRRLARELVRDVHLAEDVAGDVFAAAVRARGAPAEPRRLRGWLRAVTRNVARSRTSRESRRRAVEALAAVPESQPPAEAALERLQTVRRLADALWELDEPYRSTLVLRFFHDLPPREIAKRKGLEPATVRQHLSRGLKKLRSRLDDELEDGRGLWGLASLDGPG